MAIKNPELLASLSKDGDPRQLFLSIKAYMKISDKLDELEKCCQILYLMPYF